MSLMQLLKTFFKDKNYTFVLLFGSYSDETFTPFSDIDIGLFFKDEVDYMELGYDVATLESKLDKKVDIIVLNNLYKKDPLFAFEVLDNHIPLLINDETKYIKFKTFCQLSYLDHLPLIEQNKKALLRRIQNNKIGERNFVTET